MRNTIRNWPLFFAVSVCILMPSSRSFAQAISNSTSQPSTLEDIESEIRAQTKLPLRLSAFLPDTGGQKIYAVLRHADATAYDILLATKLPCEGGNACTYGTVQASRSALDPVEGRPVAVSLGKGIVGQFFPAKCYVFCGEAYMRWKENGVFYSIGVKAGKKDGLLRAARSAVGGFYKRGCQEKGSAAVAAVFRHRASVCCDGMCRFVV